MSPENLIAVVVLGAAVAVVLLLMMLVKRVAWLGATVDAAIVKGRRPVLRLVRQEVRREAGALRTETQRGHRLMREVLDQLGRAAHRDQEFRRGLIAELAAEADQHRKDLLHVQAQNESLREEIQGARAELKAVHDATYRTLRQVQALPRNVELLHQIEAILELRTRLPIASGLTLPLTGGWGASPTTLLALLEEIQAKESVVVVECGSGVSTLWVAYLLREMGGGCCLALEHENEFRLETQRLLRRHGLERWADVEHAPLVEGAHGIWYDLSSLKGRDDIDLLFVDGPPAATAPFARRPALAAMAPHMKQGATILLDDSSRDDEEQIVGEWIATGSVRLKRASEEQRGWASLEFLGAGADNLNADVAESTGGGS